MTQPSPSVSVVVPSYRRPLGLARCLDGLHAQSLPPSEILVARRPDDEETRQLLPGQGATEVDVLEPGLVAALIAATGRSTGDVIAFTDDDAVPRPDWLERLTSHLDDRSVGGVGGRDLWVRPPRLPETDDVGRITRWGKLIGNHHRASGDVREVMVLKGVNMAFKAEALAIPRGLRGQGTQFHSEVAICLSARRAGWRLLYDPAAIVDHFTGPDAGEGPGHAARTDWDTAYNLVSCMLTVEPTLYWRRAMWGLLVGDREVPGGLRAVAALLRAERDTLARFPPSVRGQVRALRDIRNGRRMELVTVADARAAAPQPLRDF